VCKSPLSAVLLEQFLGMEKIMFFSPKPDIDVDQEEFDFFDNHLEIIENHGVLALIEDNGQLLFKNVKDMDLYMESDKREFQSQKKMNLIKTRSTKQTIHKVPMNLKKSNKMVRKVRYSY